MEDFNYYSGRWDGMGRDGESFGCLVEVLSIFLRLQIRGTIISLWDGMQCVGRWLVARTNETKRLLETLGCSWKPLS